MTMSLSSHDSVIALLLAQNASEQSALTNARLVEIQAVEQAVEKRKAKTIKSSKTQDSSESNEASTRPQSEHPDLLVGIQLPERGSIDAWGFMRLMHNAGMRQVQVRLKDDTLVLRAVRQPLEVRNDLIKAIHAYIGYDSELSFGAQEWYARWHASRTILGLHASIRLAGVAIPMYRETTASATIKGFIAGMPNAVRVKVQDLQARERIATEDMLQFIQDSRDESKGTPEERQTFMAKALLEQERLGHIQAELAQYYHYTF